MAVQEEIKLHLPKRGNVYRSTNKDGNLYRILTTAECTDDGCLCVVYETLYGKYRHYIKPLETFLNEFEKIDERALWLF